MNPRFNRLKRDHEKLKALAARSPFVTINGFLGNPPDKYVLHLSCKGISNITPQSKPIFSNSFLLGIHLHGEYPRKGPEFQIFTDKTPIFHPNIATNGLICYGDAGDHGWKPSMGLDDVVVRIIQMIRYENKSLTSAHNLEAAAWAAKNSGLFPLDERQILGPELEINFVDNSLLDAVVIKGKTSDKIGETGNLLDDIVIL